MRSQTSLYAGNEELLRLNEPKAMIHAGLALSPKQIP
jgi:hypothetical protein